MDKSMWWLIDVVGPAILLILLVWLVMRTRPGKSGRTEQATSELYADEEARRREGTDDL